MLKYIIVYWGDLYLNLSEAFQILLTISESIAICERSFGNLKLIMTYFGSSFGQGGRSALTQLSIGRGKLLLLVFESLF